MRIARLFAAALLAAGVAAAAPAPAPPPPQDDLAGVWCVVLAVEDVGITRDTAPPRTPRVEVTLAAVPPADGPGVKPTHRGTWRGVLSSFRVHRGAVGSGVEARASRTGFVEVTLSPEVTHGSLVMTGRMRRGAVTGRWEVEAYAGGASGTFRMERRPEGADACP